MTATQPEAGTAPLADLPIAEPFRAEITAGPDDTVVVTLVGGGTPASSAVLSRALHTALEATPTTLLVDLGRLDPAAAGPILRCAGERARSQGTSLQVLPQA